MVDIVTETIIEDEKFPADIVFKAIIRSGVPFTMETIKSILAEKELHALVSTKESRNGKFVSYTVSARFPSNDCLMTVCAGIASLEGFMTLF